MRFKLKRWLGAGAFAMAASAMVGAAVAQEVPIALMSATTGTYAFGGVPIQNGMRLAKVQPVGSLEEPELRAVLDRRASTEQQEWIQDITQSLGDGRVRAVHGMVNPDKLAHLGPVADAWATTGAGAAAPRDMACPGKILSGSYCLGGGMRRTSPATSWRLAFS